MKLQGKVTCRFLSRITNHCNLLTDEAHAKVMRAFAHICMCDMIMWMRLRRCSQRCDARVQVSLEKRKMAMGSYIDEKMRWNWPHHPAKLFSLGRKLLRSMR